MLMLWIILLIIAIIAVSGLYFWLTKTKPTDAQITIIKDIIFSLVMEAEKQLGSKTGQAKFALVVRDFMRECPAILQKYITADTLAGWINEAVERMKKYFEANKAAEKKITGGDEL